MLTAEELLGGAGMTYEVSIPDALLGRKSADAAAPPATNNTVKIRPLSIGTFQLIMKAAREDAGLIPVLMVKEGLVEPALSVNQVKSLPLGLLEFLLEHIRSVSGMSEKKTP